MKSEHYKKYKTQLYNFGNSLDTKSLEAIISILEDYQYHEFGTCFLAEAQIESYKLVIAERNADDFKASIRSGGEWI